MDRLTRVCLLRIGRLLGYLLGVGQVAACAGSGPSAAETIQSDPDSGNIVARLPDPVRDKLSEELPPMPVHDVEDENARIRLRVEATAPPVLEPVEGRESMRLLRISIPEAIVECYLYGDVIDPASTMDNFFVLAAAGSVDWYAIDELGASTVEGRPYLYGTAITRTDDGDMTFWGNLHVAVGQAQHDSLACIANGLGRRQTFRRIFERMLRTLESPATTVPTGLAYHSIARCVSLEGNVATYIDTYVYDEEDSESLAEVYESTIYRGDSLHLSGSDEYALIRSQDGWIVKARYTEATRETLKYELLLSANDGVTGEYRVTGKIMDEEHDVMIRTDRGLADMRRSTRVTSDFARTKATTAITLRNYEPSVDPSSLIDVRIERKEDRDDEVVARVSIGGARYSAVVDRDGNFTSFVMPKLGSQLTCERVWTDGSLVD